ncbi:fer-1-like protein 5 [Poecile atricapillus]|uniref:fer-1-like protein 5 n=1 Tax=Poecile atricapillus TaxID=48891 RepID=UPI0027386B6D|nr:fer-1-like protein 5 [Poecile atricapillus]
MAGAPPPFPLPPHAGAASPAPRPSARVRGARSRLPPQAPPLAPSARARGALPPTLSAPPYPSQCACAGPWNVTRSVAMLRCRAVAARIPGATGSGGGVLLSVTFRGVPRRTRVVAEERSPTWNEELLWPLDTRPLSATDTLELRLRHWDCPLPQGDLGATTVSLEELVAKPSVPVALRDIPLLDHRERPTGHTVTFLCSFDAHVSSGDIAVTQCPVSPVPPALSPADRREDFQVRVRVIKGHQLRGKDIKPVVRVRIGKRNFQSRSRSGNNPYFNEVFCQNFRLTPEQLLAQNIQIQVLRSPRACIKPVIGVCELDIGTIYSAPGRSLSWKWLSLRHPQHRDGRSQGLLQLSLRVRRAGESTQEPEVPEGGGQDVASNLLRVATCGSTLRVRVFRAEELLWVEPARPCQGSVKVSVRVGFAGRSLCTHGVPLDPNPEWNEVLLFPLRLPPVCDEILLEILRGSCRNKTLARATLRLPQICRDPEELEEGSPHFLPSFGPSFVPLYGPRPDAARGSGPVFRGRLLLELCSHPGTPARHQREPLAAVDAERVQSRLSLSRCQLGLCGVFYSVSSVPAGPEPLSLELGIGGAAAATAPERPRCDGNLHHYLPWFGDKPVAAVTSHWEDAGHRWDSLNLLRALGQRLERNLAELRQHRGGSSGSVRARLLRELAQDCTDALGCLDSQPVVTTLDQQLRSARRLLLRQLRRLAEGDPEKIPELRGDALGTAARGWLRRVAALAVEPQAGVPDVQLWLVRGQRRVASARVAATDVLHSPRGPGACGRLCGRILTLFLLEEQPRLWGLWGSRKILGLPGFSSGAPPGQLRPPPGWRWAGPWSLERPPRVSPGPEPAVSAVLEELYENQRRDPAGSWSPAGTGSTDSEGQAVPPKEEVACPQGWSVTSDWHVDTEGDVDEEGWQYGLGTDDGSPPARWHRRGQPCHNLRRRRWLRIRHRDTETREQDTLSTLDPEDLWEDEAWHPECFWGCPFQPKVPAGPRCRRRRWQRRLLPAEPPPVAPLFLLRGTPVSPRASPVPSRDIQEPAQDNPGQLPGGSSLTPPQQPPIFILCSFQRPGRFQLRCYIFQALDLAPGSSRTPQGVTAQVSFVSLSQRTREVRGAPEPRWEQTLLFPGVLLFGDPRGTQQDPPAVVVEVCEQREQGSSALLGRSVCLPRVWLDVRHREPPRLQPHPLHGPRGPAGELLAAFELLHEPEDGTPVPLRPPPLMRNGEFGFPPELRPRLQRVALEVLAWGLRGLRGAVREPRLELQWGEQSLWTPPIQDMATDPNFPSNAFVLTLALPEEERFVPPIRLRLWAGTERRLLLGQASVRDLGRFRCPPPRPERLLGSGSGSHTAVTMPEDLLSPPVSSSLWKRFCSFLLATAPARMAQDLLSCLRDISAGDQDEEDEDEDEEDEEEEEEQRDWWSKFYASMEEKEPKSRRGTNRDRLKIYGCELEAVPEFEGLQDFCQTFPLSKPRRAPSAAQPPEPVANFKGLFRIYPVAEEAGPGPAVPRFFQRLPPREPQRCLLRVYIVRALELSPRDVTGLSDPYVRVSLGKRTLGQREQYVPNTLEPVFGRLFELTATIPLEKDLRVTIMDHDKVPPDQEIGSTTIDLENRLLSLRRAHCGLPARYHTSGPCCWRDQLCPSRSLELLCARRGLPGPRYSPGGTALSLGGHSYELGDFERGDPPLEQPGAARERLALHVLNLCELVPEHLETRSLRNREQPGLEQGKVQMWVDIFPLSLGPPGPPFNIDPRKAEGYELRCVVWRVRDADLGDINLLGQRMSDIYVSGWLDGLPEQRQHTDVHYRSLDGNGAFNWRFVFPFEFLAAEKLCAIPRKEHVWSLDQTLLKVPPKLILQVWDNDKFKADDLLGILELELTRLPRPGRSPGRCRLSPRELPRLARSCCGGPGLARSCCGGPGLARSCCGGPGLARSCCGGPGLARPTLDLFRKRRTRGWWPCTLQEDGGQRVSGKLELSLELLTAREAEERPVGKGREEPNKHPTLPEPRRPKSSFLWLQSPLSLVRHGLRWRYRLWIGLGLGALLLLLLLRSFLPGSLTVKVPEPRRFLPPDPDPKP